MAETGVTTMGALAVVLVWKYLSCTPKKAFTYTLVLASQIILTQLLSGVTFAPGLFVVLQAAAPPSIAFFKSLPDCPRLAKRWGVYVVVMEKAGCRPKIYIGCGTEAKGGVRARFLEYDRLDMMPFYVRKALDDGYTISSRRLLCWMPIPHGSRMFTATVLLLALECTFAAAFWAMYRKDINYGSTFRIWDLDAFEYDGLCSHSAKDESTRRPTDHMTVEEIDARNAHARQKKKENAQEEARNRTPTEKARVNAMASVRKAKYRKSGQYSCKPCGVKFHDSRQLNLHLASNRHAQYLQHGKTTHWYDKNKGTTKYRCSTCNMNFVTAQVLGRHMTKSKRHLEKVAAAKTKR